MCIFMLDPVVEVIVFVIIADVLSRWFAPFPVVKAQTFIRHVGEGVF